MAHLAPSPDQAARLRSRMRRLTMASLAAELAVLSGWTVLQFTWAQGRGLPSWDWTGPLAVHAGIALAASIALQAPAQVAWATAQRRLAGKAPTVALAALAVLSPLTRVVVTCGALLMIVVPFALLGWPGLAVTAGLATLPSLASWGRVLLSGRPARPARGTRKQLKKLQGLTERLGLPGADIRLVSFPGAEYLSVSTWRSGRPVIAMDPAIHQLLDERELAVITSHEVAHIRLHHLRWTFLGDVMGHLARAAAGTAMVLPLAFSAGTWQLRVLLYLPVMVLAYRLAEWVWWPMELAISRRQERQANLWALRATGDPAAFTSAMTKMAEHMGATQRIAWWERWFIATHPSLEELLAQARQFAHQQGIPLDNPPQKEQPNR